MKRRRNRLIGAEASAGFAGVAAAFVGEVELERRRSIAAARRAQAGTRREAWRRSAIIDLLKEAKGLAAVERLLLVALVELGLGGGRVEASHADLARLVGASERTAIRAVKKLVEGKWIEKSRWSGETNVYGPGDRFSHENLK